MVAPIEVPTLAVSVAVLIAVVASVLMMGAVAVVSRKPFSPSRSSWHGWRVPLSFSLRATNLGDALVGVLDASSGEVDAGIDVLEHGLFLDLVEPFPDPFQLFRLTFS